MIGDRRLIVSFRAAALWLAAITSGPAMAQPLVEHVPVDAVAYFGWAGSDSLAEAYAQSTLQDVIDLIDADKLRDAWRRAAPTLRQAIDNPGFASQSKQLAAVWGVSARGATAVYVTPPPPPSGLAEFDHAELDDRGIETGLQPTDHSTLGVVLLWRPATGDDRKDLLEALKFYQAQSTRPAEIAVDGEVVSLRINQPPVELGLAPLSDPQAPANLAQTPRFTQAFAQLDAPGPLVAYLDIAAVVENIRSTLANTAAVYERDGTIHHAPAAHPAAGLIQPLGLDTLGPAIATAGFDGRRWRTQLHLAAPAPRTGLAALLDASALTADDLGRAPADSPWVSALSFDLGLLMDLLRKTATAMGPGEADTFEKNLAAASGAVGVDVENQLIRGFGSGWSMYLDPDVAGPSVLGLTLVNQLIDPQGVERGLRSAQMLTNLALLRQMADKDFKVQVHTQHYDGIDLHTLGTPLLSPTWAIVNDQFIVGLTPQTVLAAIDRKAQPSSITQQSDFAALREVVGTRRLTALTWVDLRRTAPSSYPCFLWLESLATGAASMGTGQPMPTILPPLGRLKPYLEPAHAIAWVDDTGWHYDSHTPFPGASLLSPHSTTLGATFGVLPMLGLSVRSSQQGLHAIETVDTPPALSPAE